MKRVLVVCGTRPEVIKLAPVIDAMKRRADLFETWLCTTGQHRELIDPLLKFFSLTPDFDLALMKPSQSLHDVTANALLKLKPVLETVKPDVVLIQGDTATAFAGALAAFYAKAKIGHVEAGLRTDNKYAPFPEEMNRVLISRLADFHFAPTETARAALQAEGLTKNVFVTGNTGTDALVAAKRLVDERFSTEFANEFAAFGAGRRLLLVTAHRRESFGEPFEGICRAIKAVSERHPEVDIAFPVHPNPSGREPIDRILGGLPRVHLMAPLDYPRLVWLLSRAHLVLTDSGGLQEESPALGKPVLVMREVTERPEGVAAGCAILVGTGEAQIVSSTHRLLTDDAAYASMAHAQNPYGDGHAADRIVDVLAVA